ncbi:MAG: SRPBCC family protein [Chloroflexaceae bacterium]|jgi:hypothetical protein|nr:SRPBCC family protein [Chloroflexaceae bacterium]
MRYIGTSVSGIIAAPVDALWEVVSDATRHPELAGSGHVQRVKVLTPEGMGPGALFASNQNIQGMRYKVVSRVVAWDPPFRFAWRIGIAQFPGVAQIWQFELRPEAGATRATNGVVLPYALPPLPPFTQLRHAAARAEAGTMRPTLANLARLVQAPVPEAYDVSLDAPANLVAMMPAPLIHAGLWASGAGLLGWLLLRRQRGA